MEENVTSAWGKLSVISSSGLEALSSLVKAIYSQDENRLLAEEPDSTVLLDIGVHQLISIYAMKEGE